MKGDEYLRDLVEVWYKPRMRISMLLSALCYAALTIPFKDQWFIWGTELRPSAFLPVMASFIFGPAGAWGSAFGNIMSDAFGGFNSASIFGFFANLALGYFPYKLWFYLFRADKHRFLLDGKSKEDLKHIWLIGIITNMYCALIIAWGVYWIQDRSFLEVWFGIFLNNTATLALVWPALRWLAPLCEHYELSWFSENRKQLEVHSTPRVQFFLMLSVVCIIGGSLLGVSFAFLETQLNFENMLYGISRQGIFWSAGVAVFASAVFALKD